MDMEEFRAQTRSVLEETLNKLQAATLLLNELETQIAETGSTIQTLTQLIETFINGQRTEAEAQSTQTTALEGETSPETPLNS
ncbi:hypothetical protein OsccyDRAFT_3733 [Leptolyngbyaceae cyanobacterium JSC-12]|nr:hypothetical protein OsccyDRAFT_3733 [Leptolyngbyaceae cyanobacterium JSC-12]